MARQPSPETEIKRLKRELKAEKAVSSGFMKQRDEYRARATRAEQELAEWKKRFDMLLARTPEAM